jgi:hypothetical protein
MQKNHCYWRFVIFLGLVISYSLLIYASIKSPTKPRGEPAMPSTERSIIDIGQASIDIDQPAVARPLIESKVSALVKVHKRADIALRYFIHQDYSESLITFT